jgi:hypothetical protein
MAPSRSAIKFNPPYNTASRCLQNDNGLPTSFYAKKKTIAVKFGLGNPRLRRSRDRGQIGLASGDAPRPGTEQKPTDERAEGKKKKHTQNNDERQ